MTPKARQRGEASLAAPGLYLRLAILIYRCLVNVLAEKVHVADGALNFLGYF